MEGVLRWPDRAVLVGAGNGRSAGLGSPRPQQRPGSRPAGQARRNVQFNLAARREDGRWRVVFDKGCDACECVAKQ